MQRERNITITFKVRGQGHNANALKTTTRKIINLEIMETFKCHLVVY